MVWQIFILFFIIITLSLLLLRHSTRSQLNQKNKLTGHEAEKIKNAERLLLISYFDGHNFKTIDDKISIVKITPDSISGFSHNAKEVKKIDFKNVIAWKMLNEPIPDETSMRTSGTELYDTHIENAIKLRRRMFITYESDTGEVTQRKVDPYYSKYGSLYVFCHLRNDIRTLRIDRITKWEILDEVFEWDENIGKTLNLKNIE
ncbi:MAG: WYL domain-containing protein [Candidatus Omnitrophica bacterium]|nr:WYL domain-containing protein [Candidatus Omnitrophota bacterium]